MNLTLEERERRAYIEGRVEEAALLGRAIDGDDDLQAQIQMLEGAVNDLERDNDTLESLNEHLSDQVEALRQDLDDAQVLRGG